MFIFRKSGVWEAIKPSHVSIRDVFLRCFIYSKMNVKPERSENSANDEKFIKYWQYYENKLTKH